MEFERREKMKICYPEPKNIPQLMELSKSFADETFWASHIPIGQMVDTETARDRLFGSEVVNVQIAENEKGQLVGYVGVYSEIVDGEMVYFASLLVAVEYRHKGVGKRLVEQVFQNLPAGIKVEAWVGDFNRASLEATPKMGFTLARTMNLEIAGKEATIYIFERKS